MEWEYGYSIILHFVFVIVALLLFSTLLVPPLAREPTESSLIDIRYY